MSDVGFGNGCGCSPKAKTTCASSTCILKKSKCLDVDVWDDPGCATDNVVRVYNKDKCVEHEGYMYWAKEDMTISMPPSADWSEPKTICEALKPIEKCGGGFVDGPVVQCDQMGAGIWWNEISQKYEAIASSIPTGCQEFVSSVVGTFVTDLETATPYLVTPGNSYYEAHPRGSLTYSVEDYPYLAVAGRKVCVSLNSSMGYALTHPNDQVGVGLNVQTGLGTWINGVYSSWPDGYFMNGDGQDHESGTSNCLCFETDGEDINLEVVRWVRTDTPGDYTGVLLYVDVAEITGTFSDGTSITL